VAATVCHPLWGKVLLGVCGMLCICVYIGMHRLSICRGMLVCVCNFWWASHVWSVRLLLRDSDPSKLGRRRAAATGPLGGSPFCLG
jgi:hypothetical protein